MLPTFPAVVCMVKFVVQQEPSFRSLKPWFALPSSARLLYVVLDVVQFPKLPSFLEALRTLNYRAPAGARRHAHRARLVRA